MLRALTIRDFVLVSQLELGFGPGFTVFTGETGAGKSILIDALSLALGERAGAERVKAGAQRAEVVAEFELDSAGPARAWLQEHGLEDAGGCVLRRTVDSQGRSRAFINASPVTATQLKTLGQFLLDLHGQHAHQSLLQAATQRNLLDGYGELEELVFATRQAFMAVQKAQQECDDWQDRHQREESHRQWLEQRLEWLEQVAPVAGEWIDLQTEQQRLSHGAQLQEGAQRSLEALADGELALETQLRQVLQQLQALGAHDPQLGPVLEVLDQAGVLIHEAVRDLRRYGSNLEVDESALRRVEARLETIHQCARRLQCRPDELAALRPELKAESAQLALRADLGLLQCARDLARDQYEQHSSTLSAARAQHAVRLAQAVSLALAQLALGQGSFEVRLSELESPNGSGRETVQFRISTHPAQPTQPLAQVASGGELARIGLALQTVLSAVSSTPTLIFDEVDAGIGGRVAEIVGRLLAELGQRHQVLCVTHLPQVAACAEHHFQVSKHDSGAGYETTVRALDSSLRADELARMLGGVTLTDSVRRHAAELLAGPRA